MKSHMIEKVRLSIQKIEDELKRLELWSESALSKDKLVNMGAFGSNTMAFTEWLQFVLIPRVQQIIETKEEFPTQSNVAAYAYREFDGVADREILIQLLADFDRLFTD
jgi:uncharacterized protein YqcC (DUF446 family)